MAHQYETEIRAFLSGVELQFDHARDGTGWDNFDPEMHDHAAVCLLAGNKTQYQFRIKPRTVKIGSREVEAPVLEPSAGQELWYWDTGADEPRDFTYGGKCTAVVDGAAFASAGACMEAQQALRDYLLEQLK